MSISKTLQKIFDLLEQGDNSSAINYCTSALEIYHKNPDLHSARGEALLKNGKTKEALKDFNLAAKLEPENPFRFSSRAFLKDIMGDSEGAIKDYNYALGLDPNDATIQNSLGLLEEKLGYQQQAKRRFEIADGLQQTTGLGSITNEQEVKVEKIEPFRATTQMNFKIIYKVFSSKTYRQEFFAFLKNGFRLKK